MHKKALFTTIGIIAAIIVIIVGVFAIVTNTQHGEVAKTDTMTEEKGNEVENGNDQTVYDPADMIDTSTWQTYRNEEYGFEMKYPENWIYKEDFIRNDVKNVDLDEYFRFWFPIDKNTSNCPVMDISVYKLPHENIKLNELIHTENIANQGSLMDDYLNSKKVTINSIDYLVSNTSAIAIHGKYFYILNMSDPTGETILTDNCSVVFKYILRSFNLF